MIVVDTSAFLSLASGGVLHHVLTEFDIHTTETVLTELESTSEYTDEHGNASTTVLDTQSGFTVRRVEKQEFTSSRIDEGEGSCVVLARELEPAFFLTDDLRALPELQNLVGARVAISPIVLKALVKRGVLSEEEAENRLERIAETRDWLGAPIYRRARQLFE